MKAEHRKELETNTLADKMGHAMQRVKSGRRSTLFITILVGAVLVIGGWFWYKSVTSSTQETSNEWLQLDDGGQKNIGSLSTKDTNAGKAAKLQFAWIAYWEFGVKKIGTDQRGALEAINLAGKAYQSLAKECADENPPIYAPQAFLGIGVVEETKAVQERGALDKAKSAYLEVIEKFSKIIDGKETNTEAAFAKGRLDVLKDKKGRAELEAVYDDLQKQLGIRGPQAFKGMPPLPGFDDLPPPFEKK
jgi:hypothetical protein